MAFLSQMVQPPIEPVSVRALTTAEMLAERRRQSFDATHAAPTSGPVADRLVAAADQRAKIYARRKEAEERGRFYPERYLVSAWVNRWGDQQSLYRWRLIDRLTDDVAYFAMPDARQPKKKQGFKTEAACRDVMQALLAYFATITGSPAPFVHSEPEEAPGKVYVTKLPDNPAVIADSMWATVAALIPLAPRKRPIADRIALGAIICSLRIGVPVGTPLPPMAGCSGLTAKKRFREWQTAGAWPAIEAALAEVLPDGGTLPWAKLNPNNQEKITYAISQVSQIYAQHSGQRQSSRQHFSGACPLQ